MTMQKPEIHYSNPDLAVTIKRLIEGQNLDVEIKQSFSQVEFLKSFRGMKGPAIGGDFQLPKDLTEFLIGFYYSDFPKERLFANFEAALKQLKIKAKMSVQPLF